VETSEITVQLVKVGSECNSSITYNSQDNILTQRMISFVWIFEDFKYFKPARELILAGSSKRPRTGCHVRLDTCQHRTSKHSPYNTRKWSYQHPHTSSQNQATIEFQQKYGCCCGWQPHARQPGQHNDERWSSNTAPSPLGWLKNALHLCTQHRAVS
jgi:hypothetical protein